MDASTIAAEGTLTGSLGAPRATLRVGLKGMRAGELSDINVVGSVTIDTRAIRGVHLASTPNAGEVALDGVLPWSGTTGRGTSSRTWGRLRSLPSGLPLAVAAGGITRADRRMDRLG